MNDSNSREARVYHEAGHVVVGWALGFSIRRADTDLGPLGRGGRTQRDNPHRRGRFWHRWCPSLRRDVMYLLAGPIAQAMWQNFKSENPANVTVVKAITNFNSGGAGDLTKVYRTLDGGRRRHDRYWYPRRVQESAHAATDLLIERWADVEALAAHLVEHGGATRAEIERIMRAAR